MPDETDQLGALLRELIAAAVTYGRVAPKAGMTDEARAAMQVVQTQRHAIFDLFSAHAEPLAIEAPHESAA